MEYKIGQKVRIKPKDWFVEHEFRINPDYCDKETTITGCKSGWYSLDIEPIEMYYDSIFFDPIEQNEVYEVTEEDLIGQIEGFPIEVVQKMVDCQVEQGFKADVTKFQICKKAGFIWYSSEDGQEFWESVIVDMNFDLFFEKYPNKKVDTHIYYRGNPERGDEIISELEKLGGKNDYGIYNGKDNEEYYFINPKDHLIRHISTEPKNFSEHLPLDFLKSFYTEKFLPENKQEIIEIDCKKYNKQEVIDRIKELK